MDQLAGLIVSGGLIMVASSMMRAEADDTNADESLPNAALAAESFNAAYADAASSKGSKVFLAASFGCTTSPYTALQAALAKTDTPLTMYATENHATIDLRTLLRSNISFVTERKLQAALLEEGLVMVPGEACGLEEPGFFHISAPTISKEDVTAIVQKLYSVGKKFNTASKRPLASAESKSASSPASKNETKVKDEDEVSVADSQQEGNGGRGESTRKRRKNIA